MSEIEICNIFRKQLIENGAEYTLYISCASDKGGYDQIICSPSNKKVDKITKHIKRKPIDFEASFHLTSDRKSVV